MLLVGCHLHGRHGAAAIRLLARKRCSPRLVEVARQERRHRSGPGALIKDPISAISFGMALMFGTAGLPHILMRFFTVPDAKEARKSVCLGHHLDRLLLHPDLHHRFRRHHPGADQPR